MSLVRFSQKVMFLLHQGLALLRVQLHWVLMVLLLQVLSQVERVRQAEDTGPVVGSRVTRSQMKKARMQVTRSESTVARTNSEKKYVEDSPFGRQSMETT